MSRPQEFAETAALVAYMDDDHDRLAELLDDMLPGELSELAQNLDGLRQRALDVRARKRREAADAANEEALRGIRARNDGARCPRTDPHAHHAWEATTEGSGRVERGYCPGIAP